ncbi:MAG TPA: hypothetical protein VFV90_07660 [Usitatibacter sp.]|nr:hypothetical protein [Usitatibacter sp.]
MNPMHWQLSDVLQLVNLVLIPLFVYVVKLERQLVRMEEFRNGASERLKEVEGKIDAVHRRLDRFAVPPAASSHG